MSPQIRVLLTVILVLLAFGASLLTVEQVSYRTNLIGYDGLSSLFSKVVSGKSRAEGGGPAGSLPSNSKQDLQLIQLSVSVLQDLIGVLHPAFRASVNVSKVLSESDNPLPEPGERSVFEPGANTSVLVSIVSGVTNAEGTIDFNVPPGNYTLMVADFNIVASTPIHLVASTPRVYVHWTFRDILERPLLIQMNDQNDDGIISPGETIVFFYKGTTVTKPHQARIVLNGHIDATVEIRILEFKIFEHGSYATATPLQPIRINDLTADSSVVVETTWYEVSITS